MRVVPATRFDDVATMVGPKRPDANVCWCLSYRVPGRVNRSLSGPARGDRVRELMAGGPPGVLAYDGDEVVGWAAIHPRADTSFATNRRIPHVDDLDVWSLWCVRVRPGHRGQGISHDLVAGAVDFARFQGARQSRPTRSTTGARRSISRWPMWAHGHCSSTPASPTGQTPHRC
ncbi:GNAT family N-acetyltransferase [Aeromicrobium piscarium]|uniref:GNAT family N-acetyltransferase n=1 Tax=Aeromicrobium piscarium TaxID=2590901 RepID=UPI001FEA215B|nr:GNAT family N-acetyltransferase [Aeromicrobium piscarium]